MLLLITVLALLSYFPLRPNIFVLDVDIVTLCGEEILYNRCSSFGGNFLMRS
jgi:hypothetical protein